MLHAYHKSIRGHPFHVAVQLKFISDIQAGLTIENKLYGGRQIEKIFILPNQMLTRQFQHQVQVCLFIIDVFFWEYQPAGGYTEIDCLVRLAGGKFIFSTVIINLIKTNRARYRLPVQELRGNHSYCITGVIAGDINFLLKNN